MPLHKYFYIDQAVLHLGQEWMDDYDGIFEATEDWVRNMGDKSLRQLIAEIDVIWEVDPDPVLRQLLFSTGYAFRDGDGSFEAWLRLLRQRAIEAVAGIHSNPLTDPPAGGNGIISD